MRLEEAGPRTRLLAVLAGLGLLAWVAALAGAGGRVAPLPDDPSLLPPLPAVGAAATDPLGPLHEYAAIAERPLFSTDRTPRPFFLAGADAGAAAAGFDYELTSVILAPGLRMAILQPAGGGEAMRVYEGSEASEAPGWRLVSLDRRLAVFEGPEGRRELGLRVFNGGAGERESGTVSMEAPGPRPATASAAGAGAGVDEAAEAAASAAAAAAAAAEAAAPEPDAVQVEAIRQRIQARRARLQQREAQ